MGAAPSSPAPSAETCRTESSDNLTPTQPFVNEVVDATSAGSTPEADVAFPELATPRLDDDDNEDLFTPPPEWALTPIWKPRKRPGFFSNIRSPLKDLVQTR